MDSREQQILEVVLEDGTKRVLTLEAGRDTGVWCLTNDGSLSPATAKSEGARLFLRFDGARVFVGTQWQELQREVPVAAAGVRIAHRSGALRLGGDDDDATAIRPPPFGIAAPDDEAEAKTRIAPPPAGFEIGMSRTPVTGVPNGGRVAIDDPSKRFDDETRIGPPPDLRRPSAGPLISAPPAAGHPSPLKMDVVTRAAPPPPAMPPKPLVERGGLLGAQQPLVDTVPGKNKTGIKPIHFAFLGLLGLTGVLLAMSSARSQAPAPVVKSAAAPYAKAPSSSAAASRATGAAIPSSPVATSPASSTKPTVSALAQTGTAASGGAPAAAESAVAPATGVKADPSAAALASAGPLDGTERAAVLAVESGAIDKAARLYDGLAAAHPDKPAYREAARILHAKAAP